MIIIVPLLIALAGVLLFALASNPKLSEIGRIMFGAGLVVTLLVLGEHSIKVLAS